MQKGIQLFLGLLHAYKLNSAERVLQARTF
jgi:hypothetical protein